MRILDIRERSVSIASPIRNAVIEFSEMTASAVAIVTDVIRQGERIVGYGFDSNGRYAQGGILRSRFIPRVLQANPESLLSEGPLENFDPFKIWDTAMLNEKPGGHGERSAALGAMDMAVWDLVAKIEEKPLYRLLAGRYRKEPPDPDVYVYAAGGYYYPGKDLSALQDEIRGYLDLGYESVKIKIGGASLADDLKRIESALQVVGQGQRLAVDANARFDLNQALEYCKALGPYHLKWYEEPVDPLDYWALSEVSACSEGALATGENLFSLMDTTNLIRFGGLLPERDYLQVDPALSYGLVEYLRILEMLRENGWSWRRCIPHGGHQLAVHIAAGLGLGGSESYPGVFQPFGGFADRSRVENGRISLPEVPGIGIELKESLMGVFRELAA